jgi:hypothetical protein
MQSAEQPGVYSANWAGSDKRFQRSPCAMLEDEAAGWPTPRVSLRGAHRPLHRRRSASRFPDGERLLLSRARSTARCSGRRAARSRASDTTRCSCPTGYEHHLRRDERPRMKHGYVGGPHRCAVASRPRLRSVRRRRASGLIRLVTPADAADDHAPDAPIDPGFGDLCALAVLRLQMPLLRLQLACAARGRSTRCSLCRRAYESPSSKQTAARIGKAAACDSIFLGGGTPSLMRPGRRSAPCSTPSGSVWTLDARRRDHDGGQSDQCRGRALPRLSQPPASIASRSASRRSIDADLRALGRLHSVDEALAAVRDRPQSTFPRLSSFDHHLCPARPDARRSGKTELRSALCPAPPTHLSLYQLTIEPGTRYVREAATRPASCRFPTRMLAAELFAVTQAV